jgi:hypothetical protein
LHKKDGSPQTREMTPTVKKIYLADLGQSHNNILFAKTKKTINNKIYLIMIKKSSCCNFMTQFLSEHIKPKA